MEKNPSEFDLMFSALPYHAILDDPKSSRLEKSLAQIGLSRDVTIPMAAIRAKQGPTIERIYHEKIFEDLSNLSLDARLFANDPSFAAHIDEYVAVVNRLLEIRDPAEMNVLKSAEMAKDFSQVEGITYPPMLARYLQKQAGQPNAAHFPPP